MFILYALLFFSVNISAMVQHQQKIGVKLNFTLRSKVTIENDFCVLNLRLDEQQTNTFLNRVVKLGILRDIKTNQIKVTHMCETEDESSEHNREILMPILEKAIKKHYDDDLAEMIFSQVKWHEKPVEEILAIDNKSCSFELTDLPDEEETFLTVQPAKKQAATSSWCTIL